MASSRRGPWSSRRRRRKERRERSRRRAALGAYHSALSQALASLPSRICELPPFPSCFGKGRERAWLRLLRWRIHRMYPVKVDEEARHREFGEIRFHQFGGALQL